MHVDTLEPRRLMSVSLNPATRLLTVVGTEAADTITARMVGSTLRVVDNGAVRTFASAAVARLAIYARGGNDTVTLDPSVAKPAYIDTGLGGTIGADGHPHGDRVRGGSGADAIHVRSYYADAHGGAGNDFLQVYQGYNGAFGDAGDDRIVAFSGGSGTRYGGGAGTDSIEYPGDVYGMIIQNGTSGGYYEDPAGGHVLAGGEGLDSLAGFENLAGGPGPDDVYGTAGNNVLRGGGGNDTLYGRAGDDTFYSGTTGTAYCYGEAGNDRFVNQGNRDGLFDGGAGRDTADYSAATANVRLGNFFDLSTITGSGYSGAPGEADYLVRVENFTGGNGNDSIWGDELANTLRGNGGNDRFYLTPGGNDQVYGGAGNDWVSYRDLDDRGYRSDRGVRVSLDDKANDGFAGEAANIRSDVENVEGSNGDDTLVGSARNNVLLGGQGRDALLGLAGDDLFYTRENPTGFDESGGQYVTVADFISGGLGFDRAKRDPIDTAVGIEGVAP